MKIIKSPSGVEVKVYSSAEELPILRYTKFQKYLLLDSTVLPKLERSLALISEGNIDEGKSELTNAISCLNTALNGVGYYTYAFGCLVAQIGEKTVQIGDLDFIVTEIERLDLLHGEVVEIANEVKKKLT